MSVTVLILYYVNKTELNGLCWMLWRHLTVAPLYFYVQPEVDKTAFALLKKTSKRPLKL